MELKPFSLLLHTTTPTNVHRTKLVFFDLPYITEHSSKARCAIKIISFCLVWGQAGRLHRWSRDEQNQRYMDDIKNVKC